MLLLKETFLDIQKSKATCKGIQKCLWKVLETSCIKNSKCLRHKHIKLQWILEPINIKATNSQHQLDQCFVVIFQVPFRALLHFGSWITRWVKHLSSTEKDINDKKRILFINNDLSHQKWQWTGIRKLLRGKCHSFNSAIFICQFVSQPYYSYHSEPTSSKLLKRRQESLSLNNLYARKDAANSMIYEYE